ncbi:MAG: SURF1 family cytochrome oxidase biogenesis protein [Erythrobacter sp.]
MSARVPLISTIIVLAAVATMVALGVWQIGRSQEKADLIAAYSRSTATEEPVAFPLEGLGEAVWFRRSEVPCDDLGTVAPVAGTAANGQKGWAQRATCVMVGGASVTVDLGFTRDPAPVNWGGGRVEGVIAPGPRLVADPPVGELRALAPPDPSDLPDNHLAYAGQWFFFALTALVIYGLALRTRLRRKR